jgi:hypothetical protein
LHPEFPATQARLGRLYETLYPISVPEADAPASQPVSVAEQVEAQPTPETSFEDGVADEAEDLALKPLRQEWGAAYQENIAQAQAMAGRLIEKYGDEFVDWMEDSRAGSAPLVIKAFHAWANGLSGPDVTPTETRRLIKVLRGGTYYAKGNSAMHDVLHAVITKLYEIANPTT